MANETNPPTPNRVTVSPGEQFEMPCANPQCGQKVHLDIPVIEVVNQRSFSSYHFSHEILQECPNCGLAYLFCLRPWGHGFMFKPVEVEKQSRIITAPGNSFTDQALKKRTN